MGDSDIIHVRMATVISGRYTRIDFRRISNPRKGERKKHVKLVKQSESRKVVKPEKVTVVVFLVGKDGPGDDAKSVRETYNSFDVTEARPEEVFQTCMKSIEAASKR